jgi:methyl-accepting chemotaxis protein
MPNDELINRWKTWAGSHEGPLADLATRIAVDLSSHETASLWTEINLREEFQATQNVSKSRRWLELIESALYLAPIFLTWLHLRSAVQAYRDFDLKGTKSIDFLQFWAGTNNLYKGTTLGETALLVLAAILAILLTKAIATRIEHNDNVIEDRVFSVLLLDTQIELARNRSVTPRELADALTTSARQLETALSASGDTLAVLQSTSGNVTQAVGNLIDATTSLSAVTADLKSVVIPLRDTPIALDKIVAGLSEIEAQTNATVSNLSSVANQTLSLSAKNSEVVEQTKLLANAISETSIASESILRMAESISRTMGGVTTDLDEHQPHIVAVRSAAEMFKQSTVQLEELFDEFQKSSEEYRRLVEEDRRRGQK